ncbi:MAG TPA: hypothetical protein VK402_01670 [Blastococcus sp.]|nr:hypothetical protein [Blastococcus sp.]
MRSQTRLEVARRAQRALKPAMDTPRVMLSEVDDAALAAVLARVDGVAQKLEADVARYGGRW